MKKTLFLLALFTVVISACSLTEEKKVAQNEPPNWSEVLATHKPDNIKTKTLSDILSNNTSNEQNQLNDFSSNLLDAISTPLEKSLEIIYSNDDDRLSFPVFYKNDSDQIKRLTKTGENDNLNVNLKFALKNIKSINYDGYFVALFPNGTKTWFQASTSFNSGGSLFDSNTLTFTPQPFLQNIPGSDITKYLTLQTEFPLFDFNVEVLKNNWMTGNIEFSFFFLPASDKVNNPDMSNATIYDKFIISMVTQGNYQSDDNKIEINGLLKTYNSDNQYFIIYDGDTIANKFLPFSTKDTNVVYDNGKLSIEDDGTIIKIIESGAVISHCAFDDNQFDSIKASKYLNSVTAIKTMTEKECENIYLDQSKKVEPVQVNSIANYTISSIANLENDCINLPINETGTTTPPDGAGAGSGTGVTACAINVNNNDYSFYTPNADSLQFNVTGNLVDGNTISANFQNKELRQVGSCEGRVDTDGIADNLGNTNSVTSGIVKINLNNCYGANSNKISLAEMINNGAITVEFNLKVVDFTKLMPPTIYVNIGSTKLALLGSIPNPITPKPVYTMAKIENLPSDCANITNEDNTPTCNINVNPEQSSIYNSLANSLQFNVSGNLQDGNKIMAIFNDITLSEMANCMGQIDTNNNPADSNETYKPESIGVAKIDLNNCYINGEIITFNDLMDQMQNKATIYFNLKTATDEYIRIGSTKLLQSTIYITPVVESLPK